MAKCQKQIHGVVESAYAAGVKEVGFDGPVIQPKQFQELAGRGK